MRHLENLVIIGNGMAGMRTLEELLELAPDRYHITVIGAEPYGHYNRIMLSPVLAGEKNLQDIMLHAPEWYLARGITLIAGQSVTQVHRRQRWVRTEYGLQVPYDRLVLATGSSPFMLPLPGKDHHDVISFRDLHDVQQMVERVARCRHIAVIGGGLLGLEAAHGLQRQGACVTVVHQADWLLNRQLDREAAALLQTTLTQRGLHFRLAASTRAIEIDADGRLCGLRFSDDERLACDMVVMAVGIVPNIALARSMGLQCDRAILVNDTLQTFDPRIYAVGECVQHRGTLFGLVAPLYEQARVCANHLAGMGYSRFLTQATATTIKIQGVDLYSAGNFLETAGESLIFRDPAGPIYRRLIIDADRLVGAVLYGDTEDGPAYFDYIREQRPLRGQRAQLLFGAPT